MSNALAVPGSVSLLQTNKCTGGEEDAILIEGTADQQVCESENESEEVSFWIMEGLSLGGQSAILGYVANRNYLWVP